MYYAAEAISQYLEIQEWQLSEIKIGISEANSEQLVDHNTIANYWEQKRANSMDKRR